MANIYLQKQTYTITGKDDIFIHLEISEDKVVLLNEDNENEFIFDADNGICRLDKWQEVIKLMGMAVKFAREQIDKPREVKLLLKERKEMGEKPTPLRNRSRKAKAK